MSIGADGVIAALVEAPGTVVGLYRASTRLFDFLGLDRVIRDVTTELHISHRAPICVAVSAELAGAIGAHLDGAFAERIDVVRPADLPNVELSASREVADALDEDTDAVALAAASYALDPVAAQVHVS